MNKVYLLLITFFCLSRISAQTPGGVAGATLWIRSNSGTSTTVNGNPLDSWTYLNDGTKSFAGTGAARPTFATNVVNFQPAVVFNNSLMDGPTGLGLTPITAGNDAYTIFAVWSSTTTASFQRVWSQRSPSSSGDGGALWLYNGNYGDQPELSPFTQGVIQPFTANTWYISQVSLLAQANNDVTVTDQTNLATSPAVGSTFDPAGTPANDGAGQRNISNIINRLGSRNSFTEEPFFGNLAELIVFDNTITPTQQKQIFSYLALKYGISTNTNLVTSTGTTVWDNSVNTTYNNGVFGIGIDNGSGLSVTQSNSSLTGNGPGGTPQNSQVNVTLSNAASLSDGTFLMMGNDNGAFTETNSNLPSSAGASMRLARQWKVQNTGTPGTVTLAVDLSKVTVTGTTATDFRLVIDNDGNGNFGDGTPSYYPAASYTGGVATFNGVELVGSPVVAVITSADPITPLPLTWEGFTTSVKGQDVSLDWKVGNVSGVSHFEVEYAANGKDFTTVGTVSNLSNIYDYSFVHTNVPAGGHAYRIKEVDFDGNFAYSKINTVNIAGSGLNIRVLGNPVVTSAATVEINAAATVSKAGIDLYTLSGTKLSSRLQSFASGSNIVNVPMGNLASGTYVLKVTVNGAVYTAQITKL